MHAVLKMTGVNNITVEGVAELEGPFNALDAVINYCVITMLIMVFVFNSILLMGYILIGRPLNQKTKCICLFNQSLADLSVAIPLIMQLLIKDKIWRYVYPIVLYTIYIRVGALIINTLYVFIVIKVPTDHCRLITRYRLYFAVIVSWTISTIPAVKCSVILSDQIIFKDDFLWYYTVVESGIIFIVAFVIIFTVLLKSVKIKKPGESTVELKELQGKEKQTSVEFKMGDERRLLKMMCIVDLLHATTLFPYMVGGIMVLIAPEQASNILSITYLLYASSSVVDPLLAMFYNNDFVEVLKLGCWSNTPIATEL